MFLNTLCAVQWWNYIADVVVAIYVIVMIIVCAKKGFITCLLGTVSTLVALIVALSFASSVLEGTGGLFGLQDWFYKTFTDSFAKIEGFDADVSTQGVEAALKEHNVSAILAGLVLKVAGKQDTIAPNTTLAMLLGEATSGLAGTIVAALALFILIKLGVRILRGALNAVVNKLVIIKGLNVFLGAVVGALQALILVCAILAILTVFPVVSVSAYLEKSLYLGLLYENNPLVNLLGLFL